MNLLRLREFVGTDRYHTARWREKKIDGEKRHQMGDCPLTPEEVALFLRAMGYKNETQIYIASGKIFGGKKRLSRLLSVFPNTVRKNWPNLAILSCFAPFFLFLHSNDVSEKAPNPFIALQVRKEMMLTESELVPFRKHSTKLAALDYMATVAADVFMSTFSGNMARLVEGHRRWRKNSSFSLFSLSLCFQGLLLLPGIDSFSLVLCHFQENYFLSLAFEWTSPPLFSFLAPFGTHSFISSYLKGRNKGFGHKSFLSE